MTIPTRPAPPPPRPVAIGSSSNPLSRLQSSKIVSKKPPPPRPPPPKMPASNGQVKKSGSQPSISILSNFFGASKRANKLSSQQNPEMRAPPKLPAPPVNVHRHNNSNSNIVNNISNINYIGFTEQPSSKQRSDVQLINFDESPPSSPPSIKKSNTGGSDSVSMDSFCSSTSSPNNLGTTSQAER